MNLSLQQAATKLGKSVRQVRYMIQQKTLSAHKVGGRWVVSSKDLPASAGQRKARARKEQQLQELVEDVLNVPPKRSAQRYSVLDLKAFQIGLPLFRKVTEQLGDDHPAAALLRRTLAQLAMGCHRYGRTEKVQAYQQARDAASLAVCELALTGNEQSIGLLREVEQELMACLAGLLRRFERQQGRQR